MASRRATKLKSQSKVTTLRRPSESSERASGSISLRDMTGVAHFYSGQELFQHFSGRQSFETTIRVN